MDKVSPIGVRPHDTSPLSADFIEGVAPRPASSEGRSPWICRSSSSPAAAPWLQEPHSPPVPRFRPDSPTRLGRTPGSDAGSGRCSPAGPATPGAPSSPWPTQTPGWSPTTSPVTWRRAGARPTPRRPTWAAICGARWSHGNSASSPSARPQPGSRSRSTRWPVSSTTPPAACTSTGTTPPTGRSSRPGRRTATRSTPSFLAWTPPGWAPGCCASATATRRTPTRPGRCSTRCASTCSPTRHSSSRTSTTAGSTSSSPPGRTWCCAT